MIENGFVYAVNVSLEKKRKKALKLQPKTDRFYGICKKHNKALDELTKGDLSKAEHKFITSYIETVLKYPLTFYPNLL